MKTLRHMLRGLIMLAVLLLPLTAKAVDDSELPIPPNTKLSVQLLSPLSTATNKKGDKFSCRILTPAEYAGGILEGYIRSLKHSGKVDKDSHIDLAFERITLTDGRSAEFSATVVEVFEVANVGSDGRADNEGTLRSKSTRVKTSVKRAAAGALIGGLIGAVVAGGQGAAIGAAIGAGLGATTTLATKGPDLEFKDGTQFTVVCNGPPSKKSPKATSETSSPEKPPLAENSPSAAPDLPSTTYREVNLKQFSLKVPENWRQFGGETAVAFAPERGYSVYQGKPDFTHAVIIGSMPAEANSLDAAAAKYVAAISNSNPYLARKGDVEHANINGSDTVRVFLAGTSNRSGREENVIVYCMLLRGGSLLYVNFVIPPADFAVYQDCFDTILKSLLLHEMPDEQ
jgi:hypothetical protein